MSFLLCGERSGPDESGSDAVLLGVKFPMGSRYTARTFREQLFQVKGSGRAQALISLEYFLGFLKSCQAIYKF